VDGNYGEAAGFVGEPFKLPAAQHSFELIRPDYRSEHYATVQVTQRNKRRPQLIDMTGR
jgi:hypothetical protein